MYRVLIVDDDYNIREGIKKLINWPALDCHIVGTAGDAREAMRMIDSYLPDIVITDIRMPEIDGLQMIRTVQSKSSQVQFIILSAYPSFQYAKEAIRADVMYYLVKPVDDKELVEALDKAKSRLESQSHHRKKYFQAILEKKYINLITIEGLSQYCMAVIEYIADHYADEISLIKLAADLYVNAAYLGQLFRKETSYSFRDFLNRYRISCAIEILSENDMSIAELSRLTGYQYQEHFCREFKRITGKSPRDYYNSLHPVVDLKQLNQ